MFYSRGDLHKFHVLKDLDILTLSERQYQSLLNLDFKTLKKYILKQLYSNQQLKFLKNQKK